MILFFCSKLYTTEAITDDVDTDLFGITANPHHCVHSVLPISSVTGGTERPG